MVFLDSDNKIPERIKETLLISPPRNWREISEKDFARSKFFSISPNFKNFQQFTINKTVYNATIHLYSDGTGFSIVADYWNGKVRYFAVGCAHKWRELDQETCKERNILHFGKCYHVQECQACGWIENYDSGD